MKLLLKEIIFAIMNKDVVCNHDIFLTQALG